MKSLESYDAVQKALMMMKRLKKLEGTLMIHEGILLNADTLFLESQEKAFVREVNALLSQYRNAGRPLKKAMLGFDGGNVMIFHANPFVLCLIYGNIEDTEKVELAGDEFLKRWGDSLGLENKASPAPTKLSGKSAQESSAEDHGTGPTPVSIPLIVNSHPEVEEPKLEAAKTEPEPTSAEKEEVTEPSETSRLSNTGPVTPSTPMTEDPKAEWLAYRESIESLLTKVLGRGQSRRFLERELSSMGISGDAYLKQSQFRPFGQKLTLRVKDKTIRKQLDSELLAILEKLTP